MKYFFPFLIAGSVTLTGCLLKDVKPHTVEVAGKSPAAGSDTGKFTVVMPEHWERLDTSIYGMQQTILYAPHTPNVFPSSINILSLKIPDGLTFEQFYDKNIAAMTADNENIKVGPKTKKEVNGTTIILQGYSNNEPGEYETTEGLMASIPTKNGTLYTLCLITRFGHIADYQKEFDAVVNSFKVSR